MHAKPGADTGFYQKGEFRPAIRKEGRGGGGAVRVRPDTKSGGRECCV